VSACGESSGVQPNGRNFMQNSKPWPIAQVPEREREREREIRLAHKYRAMMKRRNNISLVDARGCCIRDIEKLDTSIPM